MLGGGHFSCICSACGLNRHLSACLSSTVVSTCFGTNLGTSNDTWQTGASLTREGWAAQGSFNAMRLLTWNCLRGPFEAKTQAVSRLEADVTVLQECKKPTIESSDCLWFGEEGKLGVAVQVRPPYRIEALPQIDTVPRFLVPIAVTGPVNFTLLAVWTMDETRYVRGLVRGLDTYASLLENFPVVVMGDLNSNAKWDKDHPKHLNHSAMLQTMERHGLISAYHFKCNERHGQETSHTYYHHGKQEKPYHIDFCFVPARWGDSIQAVTVEPYEDWKSFSDHRPLVVDLTF
jgi:exonuclease III